MKRPWCVLLLAVTVGASDAIAQAEGRVGQVRGSVVDSLTRFPISGATVEIGERGLRQTTDSGGHFTFAALPQGQYVIRARHFGHLEAADTVQLQPGDVAEHGFAMRRVPVALQEMVISGRRVTYPPFFADAYKRAASGRGSFFTREDIQEINPTDYEPLLNRIAGVNANDRGITFQRCQSFLEVFGDSGNKKPGAKVQVYIDGYRVSGIDGAKGLLDALRSVKPQGVQIMEVYTSTSTIPAEFMSDACAVIAIWTKRGT
ncbi:MAG TPA: carboxypeptidase regulatory-like domain-containing protein [Gemmatimonadaceae bacterium]